MIIVVGTRIEANPHAGVCLCGKRGVVSDIVNGETTELFEVLFDDKKVSKQLLSRNKFKLARDDEIVSFKYEKEGEFLAMKQRTSDLEGNMNELKEYVNELRTKVGLLSCILLRKDNQKYGMNILDHDYSIDMLSETSGESPDSSVDFNITHDANIRQTNAY